MVYRAVDQGGQIRPELDQVVLPQVRGQPGEASAVRAGLQPGQLPAQVGLTGGDEALVADQYSDQDYQDWRAVGTPCQEAGVPAGRGIGDQGNAGRDTGTDQPASPGTWLAHFGNVGIGAGYSVTQVKWVTPRKRLV